MKQAIYLLISTLFIVLSVESVAQERKYISWKNFSDSTFVFEITNKEAEKFLKDRGSDKLMDKLLYNQVATFVDTWDDAPQQGHFIYANINQNKIDFRYMPQIPFQVFLFREYGLLTLQVIDEKGEIRKDAKVRIQTGRWRLFDSYVDFDENTQTYRIDDWSENTHRILTIELDKFKAVFNLKKNLVYPSWYNRGHVGESSGPSFYSYMITDKNKYKPKEKVRFKSYALKGNKRAIKEDLEVWMDTENYNYKKITTVSPYHPGGFAGEITLHDSLELKLDKNYHIQLQDKKGRIVASTYFRYEDYELYDNKMEVKTGDRHYFPDDHIVEIKITDANGLVMPDMKSTITIERNSIEKSYVELLVFPKMIHRETIDLSNTEATTYKIPASYFDKIDGSYNLSVETITNDGQRLSYNKTIQFYKSHHSVMRETQGDSILFRFTELGKDKNVPAIMAIDSEEPKEIQLPHAEKFDQKIKKYTIEVPKYSYTQSFYTSSIYDELDVKGGLVKDSLILELVNPLDMDVSWFLYEGNQLLTKGSGKEFSYEQAYIDQDLTYYLEIFYTIGDEDDVLRKIYVPKKEYLNIETNLPDRIFPGQTIETQVKVSDSRGSGVKGVDLTAFAYNSLLDYYVSDLPYYGKSPKGREQRSSYDIDQRSVNYSSYLTKENYDFWNNIAALDKMPFYQFTYPDPRLHKDLVYTPSQVTSYLNIPYHDIFKYTIDTPHGTTEFAPYVMKGGRPQHIYAIELDNKPVYFSWTDQPKAYSFLTESNNYHNIMIRLYDRAIIIDNYCFDEGKKTIMSINLDNLPESKYVRTVMLDTRDRQGNYRLTDSEAKKYNKYIAQIPIDDSRYFYLQKKAIKYPIHHPKLSSYSLKKQVGPLDEGEYQYMDGIEYFHEGGFSYKFDKNVVYKYPADNCPSILFYYKSELKLSQLNEYSLTPEEFEYRIGVQVSEDKWFPQIISLDNTRIHTPRDKDETGVHSLVMKNRETSKLFVPVYKRNVMGRNYSGGGLFGVEGMEYGDYDVFLLYNNGKYLKYENVPFARNTFVELKMDNCAEHPKDSVSAKWLEYQIYSDRYIYLSDNEYKPTTYTTTFYDSGSSVFNPANDVQGIVVDSQGEPLIGVSVSIKGKQIGTVTDLDGRFVLDLHGAENTLVFSYIGYDHKEVEVQRGTSTNVTLEESSQLLEEVIVVGYGVQKRSFLTGSVSSISSDDSSAGSAPEEKFDADEDEDTEDDAEDRLYSELMQLDGLRTNFSDVGFWEPALVTNRKGEVEFTVTFPDNITQWDAVIYAMNRKLKTGTARKRIKSYKPLMAELKTPQFLVVEDQSNFAANIRNYTKDKDITGNVSFVQDGDTLISKGIEFEASYQDLLSVEAPNTDSLTTTYRFTRDDGYSDGEQRIIPIVQQGTEIAEGSLEFLRNNDVKNVYAQSDEEIHVSISGKQLDIYMDATYYLTGYKYACNEQLASKLIGLLNYKLYQQFIGEKFDHDKQVREIIERLLKNQNEIKLWSWWGRNSSTSYWMSAHILRALHMAQKAGYNVDLNIKSIEYDYIDIHRFRSTSLRDIDVLNALIDWGTEQSYKEVIELFEEKIKDIEVREDSLVKIYQKTKDPLKYARRHSYMKEKLLLTEMRQKLGLEYDRSLITNNLRKDVLGSIGLVDFLYAPYWYSNADASNIIAYRIVKNDSTLVQHKEAMQMHILGTKRNGWNTYQASSAVMNILPDLLAESASKDSQATVRLTGKDNKTISEFPYETILGAGERLEIKKESGIPLIYSSYTLKRRKKQTFGDAFEIKTSLSKEILKKGEPVVLRVDVKVKEENAEHIIIEVPIPAGCSYADKGQSYYSRYEVHREHFKEYTAIFCENLPIGTYTFNIKLLPRYTGSYTLNPAKVEMMYFPVVNANNDIRKVNIGD